jgi:hypothetical protein
VRRWPVIVTSIVDHVHNACDDLAFNGNGASDAEAKLVEGKQIIAKISELKYHMGRDHDLVCVFLSNQC